MRPDEFWKNFSLGTELDIAGRFLFNGLLAFHEMEHFAAEADAFEFLYSISVGVERLLKVAVILTEHDKAVEYEDTAKQESFEKSLITHTHQKLVERLREKGHNLKFCPRENEFIALLGCFYKSQRYARYSLDSALRRTKERERDSLVKFLEKHLNTTIEVDDYLTLSRNDRTHRKFIGDVVSKIVKPAHKIVIKEANRLNIYTHEIDHSSKASKIFHREKFDFEDEDILHAELMAYFISSKASGPNAQLVRDFIEPLPFDPDLEGQYLAALRSERRKSAVLEELVSHYEYVSQRKERRALLEASTLENLAYGVEDDEDFDTNKSDHGVEN